MKKILAMLLAAMLFAASFAVAEETAAPAMEIEFDGTVVSGASKTVTSAVGGSVESVSARVGQLVTAGDVLATLRTEKVYAAQDGAVAAVFGAAGDSISEVVNRYGAVLYIEPDEGRYTISASTEKAYESSDNLYVHVGESVYLKCTDGDHTGAGFVSAVSGSSYTVQVTGGDFEIGENVNVYRNEGYAAKSRIGRGSCQRGEDISVGGTSSGSGAAGGDSAGSIVAMHVSPGDVVQKGDVLYETLSGEYPAYYCTGADIVADATGILGELNASVGGNVSADGSVATIYPVGDMQIEIAVNEADLPYISEGDSVTIRFNWDEGATEFAGSVFSISHMAQSQQSSAQGDMGVATTAAAEAEYTAIIAFTPDDTVRLGMTATVTVAVAE